MGLFLEIKSSPSDVQFFFLFVRILGLSFVRLVSFAQTLSDFHSFDDAPLSQDLFFLLFVATLIQPCRTGVGFLGVAFPFRSAVHFFAYPEGVLSHMRTFPIRLELRVLESFLGSLFSVPFLDFKPQENFPVFIRSRS